MAFVPVYASAVDRPFLGVIATLSDVAGRRRYHDVAMSCPWHWTTEDIAEECEIWDSIALFTLAICLFAGRSDPTWFDRCEMFDRGPGIVKAR